MKARMCIETRLVTALRTDLGGDVFTYTLTTPDQIAWGEAACARWLDDHDLWSSMRMERVPVLTLR